MSDRKQPDFSRGIEQTEIITSPNKLAKAVSVRSL